MTVRDGGPEREDDADSSQGDQARAEDDDHPAARPDPDGTDARLAA